MAIFGVVDTFMLLGFLRKLTSSFEGWPSYKSGVIDGSGNILIPEKERTYEQKASLTKFDVLVLNLRKLLAKIPGGGSRLATFAAALYLLREDKEYENLQLIEEELRHIIAQDQLHVIMEEVTNSVSGGAIAGTDDPPKFAGHRVFDVSSSTIHKSRFGKKPKSRYKKYIDENDEEFENIRSFAKKNPKESIVLRDKSSGQMIFLRKKTT